jgi:hypothetical protein
MPTNHKPDTPELALLAVPIGYVSCCPAPLSHCHPSARSHPCHTGQWLTNQSRDSYLRRPITSQVIPKLTPVAVPIVCQLWPRSFGPLSSSYWTSPLPSRSVNQSQQGKQITPTNHKPDTPELALLAVPIGDVRCGPAPLGHCHPSARSHPCHTGQWLTNQSRDSYLRRTIASQVTSKLALLWIPIECVSCGIIQVSDQSERGNKLRRPITGQIFCQ